MLFGQSIFQSVVTRLKEERGEDEAKDAGESFRIRGLGAGFVASTQAEPADIGTGTEAYFAFLADAPETPVFPRMPLPDTEDRRGAARASAQAKTAASAIPAHLLRLTEAEIAEDLAITEADTEASLNDKRRKFAKHNHPDGVEPAWRDRATIRMKTANLLIDRAIRQTAIRHHLSRR